MAFASFGLLFIVPSAVVGFLLMRRAAGRPLTFLTMMSVFGITELLVWSSFEPLFATTDGRLILVAQILVALTIVGVRLPIVSRVPK